MYNAATFNPTFFAKCIHAYYLVKRCFTASQAILIKHLLRFLFKSIIKPLFAGLWCPLVTSKNSLLNLCISQIVYPDYKSKAFFRHPRVVWPAEKCKRFYFHPSKVPHHDNLFFWNFATTNHSDKSQAIAQAKRAEQHLPKRRFFPDKN